MNPRLLLFPIFSLVISAAFAQRAKAQNTIGLQYGIHFFSRQDQLFSPMVYHATTPVNLNLNYANQNTKRIHLAEAEFNIYKASWHDPYAFQTGFDIIKTQTTLPSTFTVVSVRYAYLRSVDSSSSGNWWVGGMIDNQINSIDNQYGPNATFGYFAHFSLAPIVKWEFPISARQNLYALAWLPVISWITRSHYAIQDDEYMLDNESHNGVKTFFNYLGDGKIHLINHYQQFNLNAGYRYSLSDHWWIGGEYRFEFFRDSEPKTVISYQNFINLNVAFQF